MVDFSDETTKAVAVVGIAIRRITGTHGGIAETGTDDGGERSGNDHTKKRQEEYFPRRRFGWVIAVIV